MVGVVLEEVVGREGLVVVGFGDRVAEAEVVAGVSLVERPKPGVGL